MKLTWSLLLGVAFGSAFYCDAHAQTVLLKPAVTRSFGPKTAIVPVLHRAKAYGCYEVRFPGTDYSPARMDNAYGYAVQDRVEIAPGVEIRVPEINDLEKDFGVDKPPPSITVAGKQVSVDFGKFLVDPKLWTHEVLNQTEYEIDRGGYSKTAYRFIGLVESHVKSYLGVCWYDSASENPDTSVVVFRLNWNGSTIEPEPIHELANIKFKWPPLPLLLDTAPNGDLLLSANGEMSQMNQKGDWLPSNVSQPLLKRYHQLAAYSMRWHVGKWLITGHQQAVGKVIAFHLIAADASTGKKVREFAWSALGR